MNLPLNQQENEIHNRRLLSRIWKQENEKRLHFQFVTLCFFKYLQFLFKISFAKSSIIKHKALSNLN